jgi:hypothetical protein
VEARVSGGMVKEVSGASAGGTSARRSRVSSFFSQEVNWTDRIRVITPMNIMLLFMEDLLPRRFNGVRVL